MTTASKAVQAFLPLKPVELELLLSLVDGERHGYGLVQRIADRTAGLVQLEPGNLYKIIKRLLADRLIDESSRRAADDLAGERRRYYALTALGSRVATAEVQRLRAIIASPSAKELTRRLGHA